MAHPKEERSLIIFKPDAIQRGIVGEIMHRFERKGLKVRGLKMAEVEDITLQDHYKHIADKPFFADLKKFMQNSPVVLMVLSGINAVAAIRLIVGPTAAHEADAGSIRGDFAMSIQSNVVHASETTEAAEEEIARFFGDEEVFDYDKIDAQMVYSDTYAGRD